MKTICEMFGCKNNSYGSISIAPGTFITLCEEHYLELEESKDNDRSNAEGIQTDFKGLAEVG